MGRKRKTVQISVEALKNLRIQGGQVVGSVSRESCVIVTFRTVVVRCSFVWTSCALLPLSPGAFSILGSRQSKAAHHVVRDGIQQENRSDLSRSSDQEFR